MAFLDKVQDLGKSAMKKAGEGVEAGKTALKINEEKGKIKDAEIELGKFYYNQYLSGVQLDAEAAAICAAIKGHYDNIEELQQHKEDITKDSSAEATVTVQAEGRFCPSCGAKQSSDSKFCASCGGKIEG